MEDDENRRKFDRDHDLLVEVHSLLKNVDSNFRDHKIEFDRHKIDDDNHFARIYSMIGNLKWYVAIGLGIFLAAEVYVTKIFVH